MVEIESCVLLRRLIWSEVRGERKLGAEFAEWVMSRGC